MKRIIALILAALLLLPLTACQYFFIPDAGGMENPNAKPEGGLAFTGTDINGNTVSFSDFGDKKLVMINFWESWCGPCVSEIGSLQALYEKYGDRGFVIIGVYGNSPDSEIKALVDSYGLTYPIMPVVKELEKYQTQYVPTTVFFNGDGVRVGDENYVGSMSESSWEELILSLLG